MARAAWSAPYAAPCAAWKPTSTVVLGKLLAGKQSLDHKAILMEDVGEQFLEDLIDRSLVQVWRQDSIGTKVKTCRIHDLFRDLCMEKVEEENFLKFIQPSLIENSGNSLDVTLVASVPRRIAIHPGKRDNFKLLGVLKLTRNVRKWHVSGEIGNLHHLRYLRLKCTGEMILPCAIGKLKNFHTLYFQCLSRSVVPNVVFKLERLRQFVIKGDAYPRIKSGFHWWQSFSSKNIESLKYMSVDNKLIENNEALRVSHIQCLGIIFKSSEDVKLIILMFAIKFNRLSIAKLTLLFSELTHDPMGVLEKLPCLTVLNLQGFAYDGRKMICSANGFPQLDSLCMDYAKNLEEWEIEEGAMPRLRNSELRFILKLEMLPEGLIFITTLQELKLSAMSHSLEKRIQVKDEREGEDFYKVQSHSLHPNHIL
ncbi:hypothetical protein Gotur_018873 [Gossypium turneri]